MVRICSFVHPFIVQSSIHTIFPFLDTTQLHITPYDTQVWLLPESHPSKDIVTPSDGVLRVYLNGMWGLVCYNDFTKMSADTVCLQRGFTNAFDAPRSHLLNKYLIFFFDLFIILSFISVVRQFG